MQKTASQKYKSGMRWIVGSLVLSVVSIGGWLAYGGIAGRGAEAIAVRVVTVERGDVEDFASESGVVELIAQQTLKPPAEVGRVAEVLVEVGDRVSPNQVLVILDNPERETSLATQELQVERNEITVGDRRRSVRDAEAALANAEAALNDALAREVDQTAIAQRQLTIQEQEITLDLNERRVEDAKAKLATEERKLEADRELLERGFIAENEFFDQQEMVREAEIALLSAQAEVQKTLLNLQNQRLGLESDRLTLEQRIQTARSEVRNAENELREARKTLQESLSSVETATIELEEAQIEGRVQANELEEAIVKAPSGGRVLEVAVKPGDVVTQATELVTIGNPAQEVIRLNMTTLNAEKVEPNQIARVSVVGPSTEVYTGRVRELSLVAKPATSGGEGGGDQATVAATVYLDRPSGKLIPGSLVSVEIILAQRENVLVLPPEMIQDIDSPEPYVWMADEEGKARKQPIEVGLQGAIDVEILSGLKPGDEVVQSVEEEPIEEGMPLEIQDPEEAEEGDDSREGS